MARHVIKCLEEMKLAKLSYSGRNMRTDNLFLAQSCMKWLWLRHGGMAFFGRGVVAVKRDNYVL